jgi:hypothetical protein
MFGEPPPPYNLVQVSGTVTNTGGGIAFNAGLHAEGYNVNGVLVANLTVPLVNGSKNMVGVKYILGVIMQLTVTAMVLCNLEV